MTRRALFAVAVATLALAFSFAAPAGAGVLVEFTDEAVCNTETGEYDVTITLTDLIGEGGPIEVLEFDVDGEDTDPPAFVPPNLPVDGSSSATFTVPGDTTTIFLDLVIHYEAGDQFGEIEMELAGDCEAIPTTTTTEATTTTTAAAAAAVTPRFTG